MMKFAANTTEGETTTAIGTFIYQRVFTDAECIRYRRLLTAYWKRQQTEGIRGEGFLVRLRRLADPELIQLRLEVTDWDENYFWSGDLGAYLDRRCAEILLRLLDSGQAVLPESSA
jgi:hypothetical protein